MRPDGNLDQNKGIKSSGNGKYVVKCKRIFFPNFSRSLKKLFKAKK